METKIAIIPEFELMSLKKTQLLILEKLENLLPTKADITSPYITASEFMEAVRIRRSKFDQLVDQNKIETIKKGRKIYVKTTEIERYFTSNEIK
jgi:hypothetical protein